MDAPAQRKEHLISMCLPETDIALIRRAVSAAKQALMESRLVRMSAEDFVDFTNALSAPTEAVPEMVELAKRSAPWEATNSVATLRR